MKLFYQKIVFRIAVISAIVSFNIVQAFPIPVHPVAHYLVQRKGYLLCYDALHRQPRWVYQHLKQDDLKGETNRKNFNFQEDPMIPELFRSTSDDYRKSGYDRGHLCPAADAKSSSEVMQETFYLSNMSPQTPQFNRVYWLKLERYVRELTEQYPSLHVYTGALYLPSENIEGRRYVKYEVIGQNDVSVPTHFFKVIFADEEIEAEAYILPNTPIPTETDLSEFKVPLERLEKAAGLMFSNFEDGF